MYLALSLNPSVINGHAAGLNRDNVICPMLHTEVTTYTFSKGRASYMYVKDHLFPDQPPKMLMTAVMENDGFNGNTVKNPFHFRH